jgi:hypothetical protein
MRVSSLSDERIIRLVSKYFVPAWLSRDHYHMDAPGKAEQEEMWRIDRERRSRKFVGGSVCVYIVAPDGDLLATLPVQQAFKPDVLVDFLEKIIKDRKLTARKPEDAKASAAPPKEAPKPRTRGGLLLHLYTRFDGVKPDAGVSQDWVEWTAEEWKALLPAGDAEEGKSWEVPAKVADKLLVHFYPPGPNWNVSASKVLKSSLKAKLVGTSADESRVRLEGTVELGFPFRGAKPDGRVTASFTGLLRYDRKAGAVTSFLLASDEARYVYYWKEKAQPARKMRIAVEKQ